MASNATALADQYARGLLAIVEAEGATERVERELYRFGQLLEQHDELRDTLGNAQLPLERRLSVVDELLDKRADRQTTAAVAHVIQSGRGRMLGEIISAFSRVAADRRGRSVAHVRTAVDLSDEQQQRMRRALTDATGRDVELKVVVDPDVVGGVLVTVGDTVIDGTVSRQLDRARARMAGG